MITLYGLKNCDTCRKARKWLDTNDVEHSFRDIREDGVGEDQIKGWVAALGWETVLNRRSTTWRGLSDSDREGMNDGRAVTLMAAHPTLIKRPVIEAGSTTLIGFTKDTEAAVKAAAG